MYTKVKSKSFNYCYHFYLINVLHAFDLIKVYLTGFNGDIKVFFKGLLAFGKILNKVSVGLTVHIQCELDVSKDIQCVQ